MLTAIQEDSSDAREHIVKNRIRNIGRGRDNWCFAQWYGYDQKNDTVDPLEHLTQ